MTTIKIKKPKKSKLPPPPDDGRTWIRRDKDLVRGDILRVLIDEKHPDWGYLYAWCSGGGFGCRIGALGNAIFVVESTSLISIEKLEEGIKKRNDEGAALFRFHV